MDFYSPFILTRHNLIAFLKKANRYCGPFVFNRSTNKLAIAPDNYSHRVTAKTALKHYSKNDIAAAIIEVHVDSEKITISLHSLSGHFGKPSREQVEQVVGHIKELLRLNGVPQPDVVIDEAPRFLRTSITFDPSAIQ